MKFTSHGYPVPGTEEYLEAIPTEVKRCGGPTRRYDANVCSECLLEVVAIKAEIKNEKIALDWENAHSEKLEHPGEEESVLLEGEIEHVAEPSDRVMINLYISPTNHDGEEIKQSVREQLKAHAALHVNEEYTNKAHDTHTNGDGRYGYPPLHPHLDPDSDLFDPQLAARNMVVTMRNRRREEQPHAETKLDQVYVVWFAKTLRNWKCLISTTVEDGRYYEVTHNGHLGETYIDGYGKLWNTKIANDEY